ncbi:acetate/propionate family kinase [Tropicimonas sp. IMCC6043]|uniref:acetate/propionate family kinase n=1 Tax=Tropicimonas sp. IMCC6043 TaxID=2510645 RepID=UPI00101C3102|nr:acetate/propionate family kinase [Tropicimonas sp. IMCC6043]RYH11801.1 acetate/propionate family kinase [Tropicimonas sp. IMCC6043]
MSAILTLNAGSSSIKFSVYLNSDQVSSGDPVGVAVGQIDGLGPDATLILKHDGRTSETQLGQADHTSGLRAILEAIRPVIGTQTVVGVGHRIVHGGVAQEEPVRLDAALLEELAKLEPLAPLHQPHNLAGIRAAMEAFPDAIQVGCFDTAFHRAHPFVNDTYALPRQYFEEGVRRYGFHGLSYDYVSGHVANTYADLADARMVIAHLGNGASMCCVRGRRSIASSMGFSAVDGLPMGTRTGQLDPSVILYLMDQHGMSTKDISDLIYKKSGLLGMSGISNDMRTLLEGDAADTESAREAVAYFVARVKHEIGALAALGGGIDALVFTGGIGENAWQIREQVCEDLGFLGISLDIEANRRRGTEDIGTGPVKVLVIRTDEERVIARAVSAELRGGAQSDRAAE